MLTETLTEELKSVSDYFKANKLKLNPQKTNMVVFRKRNLPPNHHEMNVFLDGHRLSPSNHASFLGTTIDCTLNWGDHCNNVANKISKANGVINICPLVL